MQVGPRGIVKSGHLAAGLDDATDRLGIARPAFEAITQIKGA